MSERARPGDVSSAFHFIAKFIGDPVHVQRLTHPDPTIVASALADARRIVSTMHPQDPHHFDPRRPDARLEVTVRILHGMAGDTDAQRRQAGLRLLSAVQLTEAHAAVLRDKYVSGLALAGRAEQQGTNGAVMDMVSAGEVLLPYLPKDEKSLRAIGKGLDHAKGVIAGDTNGHAQLSDKVSEVRQRMKPNHTNNYVSDAERARRHGEIVRLAREHPEMRKEDIATEVGVHRRTVWMVLRDAEHPKELPSLTEDETAVIDAYKSAVAERKAAGYTKADSAEVEARRRVAHMLGKERDATTALRPQEIADVLGVTLRIVVNDGRVNRTDRRPRKSERYGASEQKDEAVEKVEIAHVTDLESDPIENAYFREDSDTQPGVMTEPTVVFSQYGLSDGQAPPQQQPAYMEMDE